MTEFGPGSGPLVGTIHVPGDKSLSHRAVLFSAMARGTTRLSGVLDSADVRSTVGAVRTLGAHVELAEQPDGSLAGSVQGWGDSCPAAWEPVVDCGNSGTTARLLMGVLASWPIKVTLIGDESLSKRPMRRVTEPLTKMGAHFVTADGDTLPITVEGCARLAALDYDSPVASAQVKSAILIAGLHANGITRVTEPALSRNHTERLLPAYGVRVDTDAERCAASVEGPVSLDAAGEISVPRDPSSAAFLTVAALLVPGSKVVLPGVSLNETRTGFLRVLERMGADLEVVPWPETGAERVGEVVAKHTPVLRPTVVTAAEIPAVIDEIPILALAAAAAAGETRFEGVGELRVKESDRLAAIVDGLTALGASARAEGDTLVVSGPTTFMGAHLDSLGDHRLAMTWAVAGLVASQPVDIDRFDAVAVSYPRFAADLEQLARPTA
ncbi:MAG: 3-phosphoshikimate 1-carboxyvinyltransferase [Coriobacteriia bacterium]|nr:3-phosphoshikimate 1-carboxyvinyltransferase [Coriobacteriia bacterium]